MDTIKFGLSIHFLSIHIFVHPSFHRYNRGVYRGFWDTGYLPFFFLGYVINYPFQFHGYVIMGYCVQYICYCQGYWIFRNKTWGYLPVHRGYLPVYFKGYCYPPPLPSKQASTMHGYFVSATPLTVKLLLLLIPCLMFLSLFCLFSVFGSCFVLYYSVSFLVKQSS